MATPAWAKYARALKVRNLTIRLLKAERLLDRHTIAALASREPSDAGDS